MLITPCPCGGTSADVPVVPALTPSPRPSPGGRGSEAAPSPRPSSEGRGSLQKRLVVPDRRVSRRAFLRSSLGAAAGLTALGWAFPSLAQQTNEWGRNRWTFARLIYRGAWDAGLPNSDLNLAAEFQRAAGDRFATDIVQVSLGDKELFRYPFLYITGFAGGSVFTYEQTDALRNHLIEGGFLFASDCGSGGMGFGDAIRRLMEDEVFQGDPKATYVELEDEEHPVFNIAAPFADWAPGLFRPGRYAGYEYDGRLVCFIAAGYDNNCVLSGRAADSRITQQCIWQGVNVLYYSTMF